MKLALCWRQQQPSGDIEVRIPGILWRHRVNLGVLGRRERAGERAKRDGRKDKQSYLLGVRVGGVSCNAQV
jgi:hypothetical protein